MITAEQIKAARALLGLEQRQLCEMTGVSLSTMRRIENANIGPERTNAGTLAMVQSTLEKAGIIFLSAEDGAGPGVRLREPED